MLEGFRASILALLLIVLGFAGFSSLAFRLPPCGLYEDTYGRWENSSSPHAKSFRAHYYGGGYNESLMFSEVWLPNNCSYHRFTNTSLHQCAKYFIEKRNITTNTFKVIFIGDSALRGIICGIGRILSGSEVFGPNVNEICGGINYANPVTSSKTGQFVTTKYGNIDMTYVYAKDLRTRHVDWALENSIISKPYAIVYNTGAWDFDNYARNHNDTATPDCSDDESLKISLSRIDKSINTTMWELAGLAKALGVRIIYRNSHYNRRFGALCADRRIEEAIRDSGWEIWDNRNISKDVWMYQTWDGFHFDRHKIHSIEDHAMYRQDALKDNRPAPGQLEMQLSQSLLQSLCHEYLQEKHSQHHVSEQ